MGCLLGRIVEDTDQIRVQAVRSRTCYGEYVTVSTIGMPKQLVGMEIFDVKISDHVYFHLKNKGGTYFLQGGENDIIVYIPNCARVNDDTRMELVEWNEMEDDIKKAIQEINNSIEFDPQKGVRFNKENKKNKSKWFATKKAQSYKRKQASENVNNTVIQ